jgi:hypothetical protein
MGIEKLGSFVRAVGNGAVGKIVSKITGTIERVVKKNDNRKAEFRCLKDNISKIVLNYRNRNKKYNVTSGSTTNALGSESTIGTKQHSVITRCGEFLSVLKTNFKSHLTTSFPPNAQKNKHRNVSDSSSEPHKTPTENKKINKGKTVLSFFQAKKSTKGANIESQTTTNRQMQERLANAFINSVLTQNSNYLPSILTSFFGKNVTSVQNLAEDQKEALQKALGDIYNNDIRLDLSNPNGLQQYAQQWENKARLLGLKYALDVALGSKTKESIEKEATMISKGLNTNMFPLVQYGLLPTVKATYNALVPSDQQIK